ncbi:hypothetical protein AB6A40_008291 [Gnathostoma spinigerum]|uniref:Uncharacterized protein n=1 Tax=Gnathostoma spinigerum TaxID=75299 RepID=A0ABD6ER11_9BILA
MSPPHKSSYHLNYNEKCIGPAVGRLLLHPRPVRQISHATRAISSSQNSVYRNRAYLNKTGHQGEVVTPLSHRNSQSEESLSQGDNIPYPNHNADGMRDSTLTSSQCDDTDSSLAEMTYVAAGTAPSPRYNGNSPVVLCNSTSGGFAPTYPCTSVAGMNTFPSFGIRYVVQPQEVSRTVPSTSHPPVPR